MPTKHPMGILESIVEAIGKIDTAIGGTRFTFLRGDLSPTATTIEVDSTFGFYGAGTVTIGTEKIPYSS